jgi:hypothetical protein
MGDSRGLVIFAAINLDVIATPTTNAGLLSA